MQNGACLRCILCFKIVSIHPGGRRSDVIQFHWEIALPSSASPGFPEYFESVIFTLLMFKVTVVDWIFSLVCIDDVYSFRCKKLKSKYF